MLSSNKLLEAITSPSFLLRAKMPPLLSGETRFVPCFYIVLTVNEAFFFLPSKGGVVMEYMAMMALIILLSTGYIIAINNSNNKK